MTRPRLYRGRALSGGLWLVALEGAGWASLGFLLWLGWILAG